MPDPPDQPAAFRASGPSDERAEARVNILGSQIGADAEGDGSSSLDEAPEAERLVSEESEEATESAESAKPRRRVRTLVEWGIVIGAALLVAFVVRTSLAQAFYIPSPSMEPTLHENDRVLVNKLSYRLHDVHRGDIIVFERPPNAESLNPEDDIPDLIKRVIAVGGDTIEARPDGGVYVNDRRLNEPYLPAETRTNNLPNQEVPEGHVFVMGDNRSNSSDSRVFGAVDEDLIVGRAFLRIWPLNDIGGL